MSICAETKWLCENAKSLEKFSGKWVVFSAKEGLVGSGESLSLVLKTARNKNACPVPFLFHVPSKEELVSPLPIASKK